MVVAGPSGVGKGTVIRKLLEHEPDVWLSVSATTRAPRDGEVDGVDYCFMGREAFEALRDEDGFLESFDVYGDLKGTPRAPVLDHLAAGRDVLLEVDVQGALRIREALPDAVLVFLAPPSRAIQAERLRARGGDSEEQVERRLAEAAVEEERAEAFDEVVVNDDVDRAAERLAAILDASRQELAG